MTLPPHPLPPADLVLRELPFEETERVWWRIHRLRFGPLHFGRRATFRFDDPESRYGVLYLAGDPHGAFIETLGHTTGTRIVTRAALEHRGLARIVPTRPLRLVDLTGSGLATIGADNRLASGDYRVAQRWSRALHEHPAEPDGLCYRSRLDPSRASAVLFERAAAVLEVEPQGSLWAPRHRVLLADILDTYDVALVDSI